MFNKTQVILVADMHLLGEQSLLTDIYGSSLLPSDLWAISPSSCGKACWYVSFDEHGFLFLLKHVSPGVVDTAMQLPKGTPSPDNALSTV